MASVVRKKLDSVSNVDDVLRLIEEAKKIIVITGAGISVSCGIPDFRSKGGLYNTLDCAAIGIPSAELLFDLEFFKIDPLPFYKYCPCLIPSDVTASPSHRFIALLEQKKKLLRNYSQNVDGIERRIGISNVIECHGSMNDFQCLSSSCKRKKTPLSEVIATIQEGKPCYCACGEVMKPTITFFGESLPSNFNRVMKKDVVQCDLILVMGTSLKVGGSVHEIMKQVSPSVPQILINKDAVNPPKSFSEGFDVSLLGACDDVVEYLCQRLEWELVSTNESAVSQNKNTTISKRRRKPSPSSGPVSYQCNCLDEELRHYSISSNSSSGSERGKKSSSVKSSAKNGSKSSSSSVQKRRRKASTDSSEDQNVYERKFAGTTSRRRTKLETNSVEDQEELAVSQEEGEREEAKAESESE